MEARLATQDAFRQDSRAILELPPRGVLPVTVYSAEPDLLRPIFTAIPGVQAEFSSRFRPTSPRLAAASFSWIISRRRRRPPDRAFGWSRPPANRPFQCESTVQNVKLNQWQADHPLGAGLRARDIELASAEIFSPASGDIVVARSDAGPLIVARPASPKIVVLGFHPVRSGMKYQLTTPLLFANIIRWMAPDAFRTWELTAGTVGTVDVELESEIDPQFDSRPNRRRASAAIHRGRKNPAILHRRARRGASAHRRSRAGLLTDVAAARRHRVEAGEREARVAAVVRPSAQPLAIFGIGWRWLGLPVCSPTGFFMAVSIAACGRPKALPLVQSWRKAS